MNRSIYINLIIIFVFIGIVTNANANDIEKMKGPKNEKYVANPKTENNGDGSI